MRIFYLDMDKKKVKKRSSRAGLEPATFELEVQCANPLRHRDIRREMAVSSIFIQKYVD